MPYKEPWKRIDEYMNSLQNTPVNDALDFIHEVDEYFWWLVDHYNMDGTWNLNAYTEMYHNKIIFMIECTDNYGWRTERKYTIDIIYYCKKLGEIYKKDGKYYKCLEYDPNFNTYLWQKMIKILWWYVKSSKDPFWSDSNGFDEV